jgi:hypothetical protein
MRIFSPGEPFTITEAEVYVPSEDALQEMRDDLAEHGPFPVFSEGHLYPRLGKDDARFVLAVADEYERLIKVLGSDKVKELLRSQP